MIRTINSANELRTIVASWRNRGETIGFAPTMGALHAGHMALVQKAKSLSKRTVASIFVNPLQFGPGEDLSRYPRPLANDQKLLSEAGCDLLYAPKPGEIYPPGFAAKIDPGPLANILEGAHRPGHFTGVATVVAKLLLQVAPDYAFFGEKDYQQLLVVKQIVRDLSIPAEIVPVPIVRDADGLALSSRNVYLSEDERSRARALPETLYQTARLVAAGRDIETSLQDGRERLIATGFTPDYLELCDVETLVPVRKFEKPARLLAAAKIGTTRLIDNMAVLPA